MGSRFAALILVAQLSAVPAHSEVVHVKYKGPVELENFDCQDTQSSFVKRICYKAEAQYLVVLLKKTYYDYCNITPEIHARWLASTSKGEYFNRHVKERFPCVRRQAPAGQRPG